MAKEFDKKIATERKAYFYLSSIVCKMHTHQKKKTEGMGRRHLLLVRNGCSMTRVRDGLFLGSLLNSRDTKFRAYRFVILEREREEIDSQINRHMDR